MDGREGMAMSGPPSYYMHRGIGELGSGTQSSGISRPMPNPSSAMPVHSSTIVGGGSIGSRFQVESPPSISPHGVNVGGVIPWTGQGEPVKRKRGRPRKYVSDGTVSLALSPIASTPGTGSGSGSGSVVAAQKRGRGRPPGTGRKQQLASLGEWVLGSAGMGFTPHIITISVGEDIAAKIMSFSQQGPRAVCILSANGAVSTMTLRQSATSGGSVTYEGHFEILCLSGSYLMTDDGGSRRRSGGLSISLSCPDGRVIGGGVGGLLIAASPVQVIVGSFIYGGGSKAKNKTKAGPESGGDSELAMGGKQTPPPSRTLPNQSHTPSSSVMGGWPAPRQFDIQNAHIDIDLMRG